MRAHYTNPILTLTLTFTWDTHRGGDWVSVMLAVHTWHAPHLLH